MNELEQMRGALDNISLSVVGKTRVLLQRDSKFCRRMECNLGNLIADSMIDYNAGQYAGKDGWTDAVISIQNGGSFRSSIIRNHDDIVTMGDVISVLPFQNIVVKVQMTGELILSVLEWSVYNLDIDTTTDLFGAFVQFSGLQVFNYVMSIVFS